MCQCGDLMRLSYDKRHSRSGGRQGLNAVGVPVLAATVVSPRKSKGTITSSPSAMAYPKSRYNRGPRIPLAFRVQSIRVQPDRMTKLPGENEYELTSLKRAHIRGSVESGDKKGKVTLRVDYRAGLITLDARQSVIPGTAIAEALSEEFSRITHLGEPMFLLEEKENGKVLTFTIGFDPLGIFHRIKEVGGITQQVPVIMIHEPRPHP